MYMLYLHTIQTYVLHLDTAIVIHYRHTTLTCYTYTISIHTTVTQYTYTLLDVHTR